MNFKFSIVRTSNRKKLVKQVEPGSMRCVANAVPISTSFADCLGDLGFAAIKKQKLQEVPRQKSSPAPAAQGGLLKRVISWLNGGYATPKRLRVLETVALGDKRLLAVIQADGQRFLVGGGPSGVSLLTALDQAQKPLEDFGPSVGLRELAG